MLFKVIKKSFVLLSVLFIHSLSAQQNIAILDFTAKGGISADEASIVSDALRGDLVKTGRFKVLDRANMESILNEQSFQHSGCTDSACAVALGKLLNMHLMVVGNIAKLGSTYAISVEMIDVESGQIMKSDRKTTTSIDELLVLSKEVAQSLADIDAEVTAARHQKKTKVFRVTKYVLAAVAAGSSISMGLFNSRYKTYSSDYETALTSYNSLTDYNADFETARGDVTTAYDKLKTMRNSLIVSSILTWSSIGLSGLFFILDGVNRSQNRQFDIKFRMMSYDNGATVNFSRSF